MQVYQRDRADRMQFQNIYAISMPHQTDERDYLASMGYASNIEIAFV